MTTHKFQHWMKWPQRTSVDVPPTTGKWHKGEILIDDQSGEMYVCSAAGTPGTWKPMGSAGVGVDPGVTPLDAGSVLFADSAGRISEDNTHFFWDRAANTLRLRNTAAATNVLEAKVDGNAQERFVLRPDGQLEWGSGAAARDTNLYREAAGYLRTDTGFRVGSSLTLIVADQAGNGLKFGDFNDVALWRGAAGRLSTDANMAAAAFWVAGVQVVGARGAVVADAAGGTTIDVEARAAINALLARVRAHGLINP